MVVSIIDVTTADLDINEALEEARQLLEPSTFSLPERITLGKILYQMRLNGVSQRRQSKELSIPVSRVTFLQRIGSLHSS
jgi:hypothetical protein